MKIIFGLLLATGSVLADDDADKSLCQKYEGMHISYYNQIFLVRDCKRHLISNHKQVYSLTKQGAEIIRVDGAVIRALPNASKKKVLAQQISKEELCREVNNRYITYSRGIYYVDECRKRPFPNWDSYREHLRNRTEKTEVVALNLQKFRTIPLGKDMPDVNESLSTKRPAVAVDVGKVCKELEGKHVSYYSKIYRIENCQKQLIPYQTLKEEPLEVVSELTSEQWLALPYATPKPKPQDPVETTTQEEPSTPTD